MILLVWSIFFYFNILKLNIFVEAPAEVFDTRSLYEKLKAQHEVKKKEFEETWAASKFKYE